MNTPVYLFAESQLHYVWSRAPVEGKTILIILMVFSIFAWWVMAFKALQIVQAAGRRRTTREAGSRDVVFRRFADSDPAHRGTR